LFLCLIKHYAVKALRGNGSILVTHVFLTSALASGEWSASGRAALTPGERAPVTHWKRGWVGPRSGLDDVEKRKFLTLPGLELKLLGRPAHSQSLYPTRYPGSYLVYSTAKKKPVGVLCQITEVQIIGLIRLLSRHTTRIFHLIKCFSFIAILSHQTACILSTSQGQTLFVNLSM
jgi:hypothetical protein